MCCICGVIKSRKHQSTHIQKSKPPQVEPWVTRTREEMDIIKKLLRYTCINRHNSLSLSLSLSVYHTNIHSEWWPARSARKIYEMALRVATHICRFVSMPKFKLAEQLIRFKAAFFSNAIFALSLLIIAVAVTIAYRRSSNGSKSHFSFFSPFAWAKLLPFSSLHATKEEVKIVISFSFIEHIIREACGENENMCLKVNHTVGVCGRVCVFVCWWIIWCFADCAKPLFGAC